MKSRLYVIMPVASDPEYNAKRRVIESISARCNYKTCFPLDAGLTFSLDHTLAAMRDADLVLADLSLERPSCYYELGLAQALGKQVIQIAAKRTTIHQTANRADVMFYEKVEGLNELLRKTLGDATR